MKKRIVSLLLLLAMLVTAVPLSASAAETAEEETQVVTDTAGETYADLDTLYVKGGLKSHFSVFGKNASSVNLTAGTWTDIVAGKQATLREATRWHMNDNGSVGFYTYFGTLDANTGNFVETSTGNNHTSGARLDFGIALLPQTDFTVEYLAMYRPLYLYSATEEDHILKDAYGQALETFTYQNKGAGIFVHRLPVDNFGWFQSLASQLDGVCYPDMAKNASNQALTAEELLETRGILHWVFGHHNGDKGNAWFDLSARQKWWLGGNYTVAGGLNVKDDVFQTNGTPRTYAISLDETVTETGATEALISLWRDGGFYTSNEAQGQINTTANGIADGGWYAEAYDTATCRFWLSANRSTDFYGVRIYDRVLTDAERKHNRAVDVLNYYNVKLPEAYIKDETVLARMLDLVAEEELVTNPLAYLAKASEVQSKVEQCYPRFETLDELYVKDGLVALYTAFKGDGAYLTEKNNDIIWQNRLYGGKDATFKNTGWTYDAVNGGVGYDLIYGQISAEGVFSSTYAGNTYSNNNRLELGLDLLPKDDFTLEYVARYTQQYVYDARVGELVYATETGVSDAHTPNHIVGNPVDVVGFMCSYMTYRGHTMDNVVGKMRWRVVDQGGYKTWENTYYGMGGWDFINRLGDDVGVYAITRDESASGEGDSLVTSARYVHYLDQKSWAQIDVTSEISAGKGRYYHQDDDTGFYLSDRLGTTFYALRVYNRVLTDVEQRQNRAVDLMRYYDITLPKAFFGDADKLASIYATVATQDFAYDALGYAATKANLQAIVSATADRTSLTDKYASPEHLTALFTVFVPETVNLATGKWTDLVSGKTASFSYGGTNYWKMNTDGSVGYTTYYGVVGQDGTVVANAATDNYKKTGNRLQLGLSLLPDGDFSVEYFAKYKPIYVYDANEADKIARADDGTLMETDDYMTRAIAYANLQVEHPIIQLGWFTGITSVLDSTSHYWKKENQLQRGSIHWHFDLPDWYYQSSTHQEWHLGGSGKTSHTASAGLNDPTDAWVKNNVINNYGIYVDETVTDNGDSTRTTSAVFSLYRNAKLYDSNASSPNSTANPAGGSHYYDADTAFTAGKHNFWLSATHATDFFTVRIYDTALSDADKKYNYAVDLMLYYGLLLTEEMWDNETFMGLLCERVLKETAETNPLCRAALGVELQACADTTYADLLLVDEMTSLYAKRENLKAFFTTEAKSSLSVTEGSWSDYVGGNVATLGNASKGYWKLRNDGAVGYDVIYGEIDGNGYGIYTPESSFNNYSDYGTRLEFGIDLLPKGDFTVEYLAEYRPVYAVDPKGNLAGEAVGYGATLPGNQQYGTAKYVPVDALGYLASFTTTRDGIFSGRTYRGELRWTVHEFTTSDYWDNAYFTQGMSANADIFQTRNEIRSYAISRVKTTDANALVTASYTLTRDASRYATASFNRKTYEDRITAMANTDTPYNPPSITDFANDDTGYFYLSERMSTDFYAVRIYDTALTAEDYARNRFVDLLYFYDVEIPDYLKKDSLLAELASKAKEIDFGATALTYEAGHTELLSVIKTFEEISAENTLYVQDGLVALYTAFAGDGDLLAASNADILWKNRVLGAKDATFEKTGWSYNATFGGVGYRVIYGTVDTDNKTFSATSSRNTYENGNKLTLGLSLLPKNDFTLEYVALYSPVYSVDAKTGELVETHQTGIETAKTPNKITQWPDVIGMIQSVTTSHGGNFAGAIGGLRWRVAPKACFTYAGGWGGYYNDPSTNIGVYGQGQSLLTTNRATGNVGTYALTRDESVVGTGDAREVTACYTHLLDGVVAASQSYTTANQGASNNMLDRQYYDQDDDTDFYLSYKLGTTFYALRVYDRVLNEAEQKQNRVADILGYYGVAIPKTLSEDALRYEYVASLCAALDFTQDADEYDKTKRTLQTAVIGNDKQVTVVIGEEETTEIVYGDSFPLPKTVTGNNLFAWHKLDAEGNVVTSYAPGTVVELTESETIFRALALSAPETKYGVSVRAMPSTGFGMRFTATVDKAEIVDIAEMYGWDAIGISMLITPKKYVDRAGEFTREALWKMVNAYGQPGSPAFVEIRAGGFYEVDEDVCTIAGTLHNFSDVTIDNNLSFAAIGCIDVDTDGDGDFDRTVYGTYTASTCRSPKSVVESANYMGIQMTDTQRKWVDDFLANFTDNTYGGDKTVAEQREEIQNAFLDAMNTEVDYVVHPFAEGEVDAKYAHIQAISFDGLDVNGKKTRIFAYVGLPEGASAENPVPAMVLVHGGGGHAYMEWVRLWNERGYAAIAMETVGHFPVSAGSGVTEGKAPTAREFPEFIKDVIDEENYVIAPDRKMATTYTEVDEQWQYHGLSAVILSHNVLRQNAAVDSSRIGTIGVSWGGTMVSQVIGYDTRFAFAIPIYGTAYISEPERPFIGSAYVDDLWAAERNLDNFKNPILWFAWADDNNFVMSSYNKSYLHSAKNNPKTALVVLADWRHSHQHGWNQEHGYAFADSICFPDTAPAFATFIKQPVGQNASSKVSLPEGATNVSVRFHYLTEPMVYKTYTKYFESSWLTESWKTDNKTLTIDPVTGEITGTIPEYVRSYYISVIYTVNGKTLETSSSFITIR